MVDEQTAVLRRITSVMQQVFSIPQSVAVTRQTSAADIDGWDSLSHSLFILGVEDEFGLDLPIDKTYEMDDIGDLIDLIIAEQSAQESIR